MVIYVDIQRACFRDDGFKNDSLCLCIYISVVSSHYFLSRWSQRGWSLVHSHIKSELLLIFTTTQKKKKSKEGWPLVHLNKRMKNQVSQMV